MFDDARYPVAGSHVGCGTIGQDWLKVKKSGSVTGLLHRSAHVTVMVCS